MSENLAAANYTEATGNNPDTKVESIDLFNAVIRIMEGLFSHIRLERMWLAVSPYIQFSFEYSNIILSYDFCVVKVVVFADCLRKSRTTLGGKELELSKVFFFTLSTYCLKNSHISRFIWPCKSWTDVRLSITQFVTPNTHVLRHPGV